MLPGSKPPYTAITPARATRSSAATLSSTAWVSFSKTGESSMPKTSVAKPASAAPANSSARSAATISLAVPARSFSAFQSTVPSSMSKIASASTAALICTAKSKIVGNCWLSGFIR